MDTSGGESTTSRESKSGLKKTVIIDLDLEIQELEEAEKINLEKRRKTASRLFNYFLDSIFIIGALCILLKGEVVMWLTALEFIAIEVLYFFFNMYSEKSAKTKIRKIVFRVAIGAIGISLILLMVFHK